ncbi:MAG: vitamin K epoxide reductase family protein [Galbitalea sp.]
MLAVVTDFAWFAIVLLVAAAANLLFAILGCRAARAADVAPQLALAERPKIFGGFLVIAGLAGLLASYNLCVDKVTAILQPAVTLNCSINPTVQCGKNLESWQGSLFGFPQSTHRTGRICGGAPHRCRCSRRSTLSALVVGRVQHRRGRRAGVHHLPDRRKHLRHRHTVPVVRARLRRHVPRCSG